MENKWKKLPHYYFSWIVSFQSNDHRKIRLISHRAKIFTKRVEKKIEDVLGEDQFGFRRGKGTTDAIGILRIIPERTLDIDEELCVCFID